MSINNHGSERHVRHGSGNVERFQDKFERRSKGGAEGVKEEAALGKNKPGVFEKLRIRAQQTGKSFWRWGAGNPAKERDRVSYKVRGGKLTVADDDGRVIKESHEKGLEKYNGMTLNGKENRQGEMELKENWWNRRKLEQGNADLTPHEQKEREQTWAGKQVARVLLFGKRRKQVGGNWFADKAARGGQKLDQVQKHRNIKRMR